MADLTNSPYNDRFDPNKGYTSLAFKYDVPLQNSELNESQSILHHYLSQTNNALFVDGNIQEGANYTLSDDGQITVLDGKIYLDGKVRDFNEQTIDFIEEGTFEVGVKLQQEIVTYEDDENLLDQTSGVNSYLSPGADRVKEDVVLVGNDTEAATIYRFEDGELFSQTQVPEISKINDILAQRTFDESGSYRVRGLDIYSEVNKDNENMLDIVVDPGRAYILGYQVTKPDSTRQPVSKALDTRRVENEAFFYDNSTRRGRLGNYPVAEVNSVTGQIRATRQTISRGATPNGTDTLPHSSVFNIERVWTEDNGELVQEYTRGQDFQLINGNAIDWSPTGAEPNTGTTYFVTYNYNKTMVRETDYKVTIEGSGDNRRWFIDFNGMTGNIPIVDSMVTVDYTYYLARVDLIIMDKDGEVIIKQGEPDALQLVQTPYHEDPYTLILGNITIYPDSYTTAVRKSNTSNLSMIELQKVKTRVEDLEYNQAANALDQPAMEGVNPVTLRGVFSDGFISTSKADTTHPDMTAAFSFEDAEITLPYSSVTARKPSILANSDAHIWGRLVTAPFEERIGIEQSHATETININPYQVFNKRAMMKLTPSEDSWVEESNTTVFREDYTPENGNYRLRRWWAHNGNRKELEEDRMIANSISLDEGQSWDMTDEGMGWAADAEHGRTGTILKDGGQQTMETAIQHMRRIDVHFEGQNFLPNANNLRLLFDGIFVPVQPAGGNQAGSQPGTIQADADGKVEGTFRIPEGIRTGTRQVFLQNDSNAATSTFTSQGINRTVEDVIIRKHVTIDLYDPLAQSFQFPTNQIVSSFGLFFASKDNVNNVSVQVRNVTEGGQPGKEVYASATLTPSQVRVSDDASLETKVTFDDPLVMDAGVEYAVVVLTDSSQYTHHIATRGQQDVKTGNMINKNPYNTGVLYSSSNASAWTVHQDSDLKFRVYTADFNEQAVLEFQTLKDVAADSLLLMASYLTPENTGCIWDVKLVMDSEAENVDIESKPWRPIANLVDVEVGQIAREVKLRATFNANRNMSPMLSLHDITLTTFLSALNGSYVGRSIDMSESPFNTIRMQYEAYEPGGSQIIPRYSIDGGTTWKEFTVDAVVQNVDGDFNDFTFEEQIASGNQTYDSIKVRLDLSTQNSFVRPRAARLRVNLRNE